MNNKQLTPVCVARGFVPFLLAVSFALPLSANPTGVLVSTDDLGVQVGPITLDSGVTGFTGTLNEPVSGWEYWDGGGLGSTDGTFGASSVGSADTTANSTWLVNQVKWENAGNTGNPYLTLTLNNTSGSSAFLDAFHFDAYRAFPSSVGETWTLEVLSGGGITAGVVASGTILNDTADGTTSGQLPANTGADYRDISASLLALDDNILEDGASVTFKLILSEGTNGSSQTRVDNFAVTAIDPPQPPVGLVVSLDDLSTEGASLDMDSDASGFTGTLGNPGTTPGWSLYSQNGFGSVDAGFGASTVGIADSTANATWQLHQVSWQNRSGEGVGSDPYLTLTVTNSSGATAELDGFHFDAYRSFGASVGATYTLEVLTGSGISEGEVASGTIAAGPGNLAADTGGDYEDISVELFDLADRSLESGASVTFKLTFSAATSDYAPIRIDNFAVTAGATPPQAPQPPVGLVVSLDDLSTEGASLDMDSDASGFTGTLGNPGTTPGWSLYSQNGFGSVDAGFGASTVGIADSTANATWQLHQVSWQNRSGEGVGSDPYLTLTVTNSSGATAELDGFHFDAYRSFGASVGATYTLEVLTGSGISEGEVASGTIAAGPGNLAADTGGDYEDISVELFDLADRSLESGASVTFKLTFSAATSDYAPIRIDNFAVTAGATPPQAPQPPVGLVVSLDNLANDSSLALESGAEGFSGTLDKVSGQDNPSQGWGNWDGGGLGSTDGTFGTSTSGADASANSTWFVNQNNWERDNEAGSNPSVTMTVSNNSTVSAELDGFHFDAYRAFPSSPGGSWTLSVQAGGGISAGVVSSGTIAHNSADGTERQLPANTGADYRDVTAFLFNLADRTLASGESATFELSFSAGTGSSQIRIDNFAVTAGGVQPVPGQFSFDDPDGNLVGALSNEGSVFYTLPGLTSSQATMATYATNGSGQAVYTRVGESGPSGNAPISPSWTSGKYYIRYDFSGTSLSTSGSEKRFLEFAFKGVVTPTPDRIGFRLARFNDRLSIYTFESNVEYGTDQVNHSHPAYSTLIDSDGISVVFAIDLDNRLFELYTDDNFSGTYTLRESQSFLDASTLTEVSAMSLWDNSLSIGDTVTIEQVLISDTMADVISGNPIIPTVSDVVVKDSALSGNVFSATITSSTNVDVYKFTDLEAWYDGQPVVTDLAPGSGVSLDTSASQSKAFYIVIPEGNPFP